jgi:hypothetical protein
MSIYNISIYLCRFMLFLTMLLGFNQTAYPAIGPYKTIGKIYICISFVLLTTSLYIIGRSSYSYVLKLLGISICIYMLFITGQGSVLPYGSDHDKYFALTHKFFQMCISFDLLNIAYNGFSSIIYCPNKFQSK